MEIGAYRNFGQRYCFFAQSENRSKKDLNVDNEKKRNKCGEEMWLSRQAHDLKKVGSIPASALINV